MSEFSRETLLNIIETDHVQCGEASALARMALAAMDSSESVELPLDYLQGHKDGLEWAAQLAEANHPETGDWVYDDPIELSKAIRKGPDMPPSQPVADSEPVAWMHNNNNIGIPAITVSQKIGNYWMSEFKDVQPLYRHAQPADEDETEKQWRSLALQFDGHRMQAISFLKQILKELPATEFSTAREFLKAGPLTGEEILRNRIAEIVALSQPTPVVPVMPDDVLDALQKVARLRLDLNDFDGDRRGIDDCLCDAEEALIEVVNRRAAMLNGGKS